MDFLQQQQQQHESNDIDFIGFGWSVTKRLQCLTHAAVIWDQRAVVDLNNAVASTSDHQASGWVHVHASDVVLPFVERGQCCSTAQHTRNTHTQTHTDTHNDSIKSELPSVLWRQECSVTK